jgi:hypothetical protein
MPIRLIPSARLVGDLPWLSVQTQATSGRECSTWIALRHSQERMAIAAAWQVTEPIWSDQIYHCALDGGVLCRCAFGRYRSTWQAADVQQSSLQGAFQRLVRSGWLDDSGLCNTITLFRLHMLCIP